MGTRGPRTGDSRSGEPPLSPANFLTGFQRRERATGGWKCPGDPLKRGSRRTTRQKPPLQQGGKPGAGTGQSLTCQFCGVTRHPLRRRSARHPATR